MSIREEIKPYIDGYGLVAPHTVATGTMRSCDNGVQFVSEYYSILVKLGEATASDAEAWEKTIESSMRVPGLLLRAPNAFNDMDGPDNYVGALCAASLLNRSSIPRQMLLHGLKNFGSFNQTNPNSILNTEGKINWESFLWRQLQLLGATAATSNLPWYLDWLFQPFYFYAALVIFYTAKQNLPLYDADGRRLCWQLIQATRRSWICRLTSKLWFKKLYKDFPDGMRGVARTYYQTNPEHPFIKFWVD